MAPVVAPGPVPELPEIRALAERLAVAHRGGRLVAVVVPGFSGLKTVEPRADSLVGAVLSDVWSRGKFLALDFGERGRALVHLGNAGRLDVEQPAKETRPRGALVRFRIEDAGLLIREHGTERRAGLWVLAAGDEGPLAALGPEPFDEGYRSLVMGRDDPRRLHTMLRDQRTVAGIGRGYSDDVLHRAELSPFSSLARLGAAERLRLVDATTKVLQEALDRERERSGGLSDAKLGNRFAIHRHAGEPCPRCGRKLERVAYDSNEIVYCPTCQTKGRVLADRRLSRLVR